MTSKIFKSIFFTTLTVLVCACIVFSALSYNGYIRLSQREAERECRLVKEGIEHLGEEYIEDLVVEGVRVTLIRPDGTVVYDSDEDTDPSTMENHKNREEIEPIEKESVIYVPALQCARALGVDGAMFCNDNMAVFGERGLIESFGEDARLPEATSFLIFGEYPTSFTPEEFKYAREKWRERTLGNKEINDLSDPLIAFKIKQIEEKCDRLLESMHLEEGATVLFGEMRIPVESDELSRLYYPLADLAKAYGTYGTKYYKDPELCKKIRDGMQWGYEHLYGEAELTNSGWRDIKACNWWHWMVGAPDPMTDVLIYMEDEFTDEERARYLKLFIWFLTWRCNRDDSAMTRVVVCTKAALILEKPEMLMTEYNDYNFTIRVGMDSSVHIDYTDWTHSMPYNVGYGQLKLDRSLYVASNLAGTAMQFRSPRTYNLFEMIKYTFEPAIYKAQAYVMFHGRNNHITEVSAGSKICVDAINMIGVFGAEEDEYVKKFIRRNAANPKICDNMIKRCGLYSCSVLGKILALPMPEEYQFAYSWYTGDRATQHRNGYAVGISMNSSRSKSYESILNMNMMGWYTTDGATYYYTDYDDAQYDGVNFMFNPEVAHRIPGTTEDSRRREPRSIDKPWYSTTAFAGGVTARNTYSVSAMEYVSEFYDGPEEGNISGYGGTRAVFANDLFANKAWFCLDDEIVSVGSKIGSTMNSEVKTTAEHRRIVLDSERDIILSVDGERRVLPKENYSLTLTGVDYVYMQGHGGFVFEKDASFYIRRYISEECEGQSFVEFGISHGVNPKGEKYMYVALLHKSEEFVREYARSMHFDLISVTDSVIALKKDSIGFSGYVFYAPDRCGAIETDSAMILTLMRDGDVTELTVSDPTHKLSRARITVYASNAEVIDSHSKMSAEAKPDRVEVDIDFTESYGRPYFIKIKNK